MSDKITSAPPGASNEVAIIPSNEVGVIPSMDFAGMNLEGIDLTKKKQSAVNLRTSNLKFEAPGESHRLLFMQVIQVPATDVATGEQKFDDETGHPLMQDAVIFYNPANKGLLMARQTVIVSVCLSSKFPPQTPLEITYAGDLKSKKGLNYQNFEVFKLED